MGESSVYEVYMNLNIRYNDDVYATYVEYICAYSYSCGFML